MHEQLAAGIGKTVLKPLSFTSQLLHPYGGHEVDCTFWHLGVKFSAPEAPNYSKNIMKTTT